MEARVQIHECFMTNLEDPNINETTSYVDLSSLYGVSQQEQDSVRNKASGLGLLWPDSIASARLMAMPAAVVAIMVLFSRNHNHIAERIHQVNEEKKYLSVEAMEKLGGEEKAKKTAWQDEDIFQKVPFLSLPSLSAVAYSCSRRRGTSTSVGSRISCLASLFLHTLPPFPILMREAKRGLCCHKRAFLLYV
jgi:hypothetical protein